MKKPVRDITFYQQQWALLHESIKAGVESITSDSPMAKEIKIQFWYIYNILIENSRAFDQDADFIFAYNTLEQAKRYLTIIEELNSVDNQYTGIIEMASAQIQQYIEHCDHVFSQRRRDLDLYSIKSRQFKQHVASLMMDKQACSRLNHALSAVKNLFRTHSTPRIYISYSWPTEKFKDEEAWIQPFLVQLQQHLKMAGLTVLLDIQDQMSEITSDFANRVQQCDIVLLVGTTSLKTQLYDPYCRIDKLLVSTHRSLIPIQLTGLPRECFPREVATFHEALDWRQSHYFEALMQLIWQCVKSNVAETTYRACWQQTLDAYSDKIDEVDPMQDAREMDQYFSDRSSRLEQSESFQHVKRQRSLDPLESSTAHTSQSEPPAATVTFNRRFQLPHPFPDFTGRESTLQQLSHSTQERRAAVISHGQHVTGTGGIGKTQLAIMFANRQLALHQLDPETGYAAVVWFTAGYDDQVNSQGLLNTQFISLARQLSIDTNAFQGPDLYRRVYDQLATVTKSCLVVFDNASKYKHLLPFLPNHSKLHVLVTTRNANQHDWAEHFEHIPLHVFELEDAVAYIKKVISRTHPNFYNEPDAVLLANTLGRFPLALTQALSYITENEVTIQDYVVLYTKVVQQFTDVEIKHDPYDQEKKQAPPARSAHRATVWTTIQLCKQSVTDPIALNMLHCCSYFAPEAPINAEMLIYWSDDEFEATKAIRTLRKYSFLRDCSVNNHLTIHKLVQEILRSDDDEVTTEVWLSMVTKLLTDSYNIISNNTVDEERRIRLLAHLKLLQHHLYEYSSTHPGAFQAERVTNDYFIGVIVGSLLGEHQIAYDTFKMLSGTLSRMNTRYMPLLAASLNNLGAAACGLGKYSEQIDALQAAQGLWAKIYGPNHFEVARVLTNLGSAYQQSGQANIAKQVLLRALGILECTNAEVSELAMTLGTLALPCKEFGEFVVAEQYLTRALCLLETAYSKKHPTVATTLLNLANLCQTMGRSVEARDHLERALEILESHFGPEHVSVSLVLTTLGDVYRKLSDLPTAKRHLERALLIKERAYGADHAKVATTLTNLGNTLIEQDEFEQGIHVLNRALDIYQSSFGEHHRRAALVLAALGLACKKLKRFDDALSYYQRALEIYTSTIGEMHPDSASIINNLANLYSDMGDYERAVAHMQKAIQIRDQVLGKNSIDASISRYNLANIYYELGEYQQALAVGMECISPLHYHLGEEHPYTRSSIALCLALEDILSGTMPQNALETKSTPIEILDQILRQEAAPSQENITAVAEFCASLNLTEYALTLVNYCASNNTTLHVLLLRADIHLKAYHIAEAQETLGLCTALFSGNPQIAEMYVELEKVTTEINDFRTQVRLWSKQNTLPAETTIKYAQCLRRLGQVDQAIQQLTALIEQTAEKRLRQPATVQMALCYYVKGDFNRAMQYCENATQIEENKHTQALRDKINQAIIIAEKLQAFSQIYIASSDKHVV